MWKKHRWIILLGTALVLLSVALHFAHYLIFHDAHHVLIYLAGDIAFVPLEVFLVAVVIERIMAGHERRERHEKMNMPIGTFFGEFGTELLGRLVSCVNDREQLAGILNVRSDWSRADFRRAEARLQGCDCDVAVSAEALKGLRELLDKNRDLLLLLLANPNLLEREQFSDVLSSIFHLMSELRARPSLGGLPDSDMAHLAGDVRRALTNLCVAWLHYCRHLQVSYPYVFSIVVRTHPLQEHPDAVVRV
jgi:hypothetical protein